MAFEMLGEVEAGGFLDDIGIGLCRPVPGPPQCLRTPSPEIQVGPGGAIGCMDAFHYIDVAQSVAIAFTTDVEAISPLAWRDQSHLLLGGDFDTFHVLRRYSSSRHAGGQRLIIHQVPIPVRIPRSSFDKVPAKKYPGAADEWQP